MLVRYNTQANIHGYCAIPYSSETTLVLVKVRLLHNVVSTAGTAWPRERRMADTTASRPITRQANTPTLVQPQVLPSVTPRVRPPTPTAASRMPTGSGI